MKPHSSCFRTASLAAALLLPFAAHGQLASTWDFIPGNDPFTENALLDLRHLNEDVAGQSGWVYQEGSQIYLGDGTPVRFWGVNGHLSINTAEEVRDHARTLAKRGVNLNRHHSTMFNSNINDMNNAHDPVRIDQLQRNVAIYKEEGIYTKISIFFILSLRVNPNWGLEGYDEAYLAGNNRQPFGLLFFNETFQEAFKNWLREALASPNPYEPNQTPVGQDPAVAFMELQNEDNLFFHTFSPAQFPEPQRRMIERKFGDWAAENYGSINAALQAWNSNRSRDNVQEGRLEAPGISGIAGQLANSLRNRDYVRFLAETQKAFWENIKTFLREEIGYGGLIMASNWKTADDSRLLDLEHWTYAAGDTIGANNYFDPILAERPPPNQQSFGPGQVFWTLPGSATPARIPATRKHVENRTTIITEFAWVSYAQYRAESTYLTSAYGALGNVNAFAWFSAEGENFTVEPTAKWPVMIPSVLGQFPATALMFRRADIAQAPVVVREGRTFDHLVSGQRSAILQPSGFDATRDDPLNFDPVLPDGSIDLLSFAIGRVELAFDTDDNYVIDTLSDYVDTTEGVVRSITGEVTTRINDEIVIVDTPRSQGVVGRLNYRTQHSLSDVIIRAGNDFGAIFVTALDDAPISQSTQLLVQIGMPDQASGFSTRTVQRTVGGQMVDAEEVMNLGSLPQTVERLSNGRIRLRDNDRVTAVRALTPHGYFRNNVSGFQLASGYQFDLPADTLYVLIDLAPPAELPPVITTKALPTAEQGVPYDARLSALSGEGQLSWEASGLPKGLSVDANGMLQGTPSSTGVFTINLLVTDASGQSDTVAAPLWVRPAVGGYQPPEDWQQHPLFGTIFVFHDTGWSHSPLIGFFFSPATNGPWVYHHNHGWIYFFDGSLQNGSFAYSFELGWIYASQAYNGSFHLFQDSENPWRKWF